MNEKRYSDVVGKKFYKDGSVRTYPGNTIICKVDPRSKIYQELLIVRDQLQTMPWAGNYAFLPSSSYHMTVFRGVNDQVRIPEYWSTYIPLDAPLEHADKLFAEKFRSVQAPESISMEFKKLELGAGIAVHLQPKTTEDAHKLKSFRDEISEQFGVRFPDHDWYKYHITLAYNICRLTEAEEAHARQCKAQIENYLQEQFGVYESPRPRLVFFNDMFKFSEQRS
ncbi:DUF1868 domain-containing protein [Paenibacillus sp. P26]|nr:DUF1868 domain-containing protein [Paenibacillus sp. P26]UUZ93406.1 DUF1868 domain-containing protein [Paenibacillus sp. P25]